MGGFLGLLGLKVERAAEVLVFGLEGGGGRAEALVVGLEAFVGVGGFGEESGLVLELEGEGAVFLVNEIEFDQVGFVGVFEVSDLEEVGFVGVFEVSEMFFEFLKSGGEFFVAFGEASPPRAFVWIVHGRISKERVSWRRGRKRWIWARRSPRLA